MGYKKKYEEVYQYILDCINSDNLSENASDEEKVKCFIDTFHDEYDNAYRRKLYPVRHVHIANYLQGLPSVCSIDFTNYDIEQLCIKFGLIKDIENPSPVIDNWFNMIAFRIIEMADYYDLEFHPYPNDR